MSTAPQYNPHYTVDDYQFWEGDWELWNGVAVAMAPSPFGRHGQLLAQLAKVLGNAIDAAKCDAAKCDATVIAEVDWIVAHDTILRPDLTIVCGGVPQRHVEEVPALVVEIHSPSTRQRDQTFKKRLYQQQSVPWYLMIDPQRNRLQALKLDGNGDYQLVAHSEILVIDLCNDSSLSVRVDGLFS